MDPDGPTPALQPRSTYWLTRFFILRLLGFVYAVAFLVAARQLVPLIGSDGLLPVARFLAAVRSYYGSAGSAWWHFPTLFWFGHSDGALLIVSWLGFALAVLVLAGYANVPLMAALWVLYLSIIHVGQDWYGYGWEAQLIETGFLSIFLSPWLDGRPFSRTEPPRVMIWLQRWLIFRIMLGAGLIKLRGDVVWRNLTALYYHFETQPLPGPLSRWFDFLPHGVLRGGVVFNHLAELAAPLFVFGPRRARLAAGTTIVLFQFVLILSGNLSFLNWLTIVPALACLDDGAWLRLAPFLRRARAAAAAAVRRPLFAERFTWLLAALVAVLSIQPVVNLASAGQVMNTSFEDPFELVNTYGAFGTVGRERYNVVFEGTDAPDADPAAEWKPYPYQGLPVALDRRPPQVAPYQLRLDWQMWFAAMGTPQDYPWTLNLVWKLLHNDSGALSLFASNPFPQAPPRYIRATLYRYWFVRPNPQGLWWGRKALGLWLPPLSASDPRLHGYLEAAGWLGAAGSTTSQPASSSKIARAPGPARSAAASAAPRSEGAMSPVKRVRAATAGSARSGAAVAGGAAPTGAAGGAGGGPPSVSSAAMFQPPGSAISYIAWGPSSRPCASTWARR